MVNVANDTAMACQLETMPGFSVICNAELASQISTIERFRKEASHAVYLDMANLDHSAGNSRRLKRPKHITIRTKAAMMTAMAAHRKLCP